tara:strand:+ start:180 stop:479 length:300 start_codon:yes stop_codon:yes gene_type:complete
MTADNAELFLMHPSTLIRNNVYKRVPFSLNQPLLVTICNPFNLVNQEIDVVSKRLSVVSGFRRAQLSSLGDFAPVLHQFVYDFFVMGWVHVTIVVASPY